MKDDQVTELLYQALETEIGGVQVYTTAITVFIIYLCVDSMCFNIIDTVNEKIDHGPFIKK